MEFKCDCCGILVHSQAHWDDHLKGKAHHQNVELQSKTDHLMKRSVYLNNFTKQIDDSELAITMGQFGEIDRVILDRSGSGAFAIVEFKEEDAAQNLLNSFERLRIGKCNVRIHSRRVDFEGADFDRFNDRIADVKSDEVFNYLNEIGSNDFESQMKSLIDKFTMTATKMNERAEFAHQLKSFIQSYFSSPLQIRVFGSSSTGIGFANSDLDLNFVFDEDLVNCCGYGGIPSVSSSKSDETLADTDKQLTPEVLKQSPIDRDAFDRLSKIDRVRLLNRLINEFRKEKGLITAHVPVPDARTPIVRFLIRYPSARISCELSVQNLLGECKANLIRDLVKAETTGTLLRLFFFFKLWASCNGLFSSENHSIENKRTLANDEEGTAACSKQRSTAHPKTHWNSYALSLLVVTFLQQKNRIPPIQLLLRHNSRNIEGWPIEYDLSFFALDEELPTLLKGLFTFLYQQIKENHVIAPRDGRVFRLDEFKGLYVDEDKRIEKKWRFSLVNIQDPLELSHNVAANVSKPSLALLRWKVMYGIAMLKRSPNDFRPLFRLNDPEKLKEERRTEKAQNQAIKHQQNSGGRACRRKGEKMEVD